MRKLIGVFSTLAVFFSLLAPATAREKKDDRKVSGAEELNELNSFSHWSGTIGRQDGKFVFRSESEFHRRSKGKEKEAAMRSSETAQAPKDEKERMKDEFAAKKEKKEGAQKENSEYFSTPDSKIYKIANQDFPHLEEMVRKPRLVGLWGTKSADNSITVKDIREEVVASPNHPH